MSNSIQNGVKRFAATLTVATTVLSLSGIAFVAPTAALAAVPADYGLREGDVISANGNPSDAGYDPDLYIVNDWGYKRLFLNPAIFNFYGHLGGFAAVKKVSPAARDAFPTSGLFRNCETNDQRVYGLEVTSEDGGVLHWVNTTGAQATIDDPNFFKKVFCINNNEFAWYPKGSDYTSVNQVPDYNRQGPGATPTPTPTSGGLNGGAGALQDAQSIGSLSNEEVGEGESDVPVSGLDLEADSGSDLRILSVRVSFEETAGGPAHSDDLDDYADEVSLWFNGAKVADEDVSDFNEDTGVWSKSISLTGSAIIRMNQTEDLKVAVSALNNIDSVDLANDGWEVTIENVRYVDAQGAITTDDSTGDLSGGATEDFDFSSFATAADLELNLDEASDNPDARVIDVDDTSTTDGVVLLTGELEATGGDIDLKELTVNLVATGSGSHDVADITDSVMLEVDGDVVQTLSTSTDCGAIDDDVDCVFDDVDVSIAEDDNVKIRVLVDINGTEDHDEGSILTANIDNADTDAEDQNGDTLTGSDLTGTAVGEDQGFYSEGIQVAFESASESKVTSDGAPDLGTFTIKFKVTAFDTDAFIDGSCENEVPTGAGDVGEGTVFSLDGTASGSGVCDLTNSDETGFGNFEVNDGETHSFTLTVAVQGANDFVTLALESINWAITDSPAADEFYTFNLDEFKTDALYLSAL